MSSLTTIASRLLGGGRRGGASPGSAGRPTGAGAGAGGSSTDAALGKGVRGVLRKLRR